MNLYKRLYKLSSTKVVYVWELYSEGDEYWTVYGQNEGKKVTSARTRVVPKVNRTLDQQMTLELDSKVEKQRRGKYVDSLDKVNKADKQLPGYTAMLAKKWEDQQKNIKFPCIVQPKLDGVRCLVTADGMFSRGRKVIESCEHIHKTLAPLFKKYPHLKLDGELYNHKLKSDFETIIKAVRKTKKHRTDEDLKLQGKIEYHIYDVPEIANLADNTPFRQRFEKLKFELDRLNLPNIVLVETKKVNSSAEVLKNHDRFLKKGYEGSMVRNEDMVYKAGRSGELLKLKDFDEDEFDITDVLEGKGSLAGHAACFVLLTKNNDSFKAKLDGSFERLKWIWENKDKVIGKVCTVAYQGITNSNKVPRFPVAKDVRGVKDGSDWF